MAFLNREILEAYFETTVTSTQTDLHKIKTPGHLQHILDTPVFINNLVNTLRTRLGLGICFTWHKWNWQLFHIYSRIYLWVQGNNRDGLGVIIRLVSFSSSHWLADYSFSTFMLIGPCRVFTSFCESTAEEYHQNCGQKKPHIIYVPLLWTATRMKHVNIQKQTINNKLRTFFRNSSATTRALALTDSFISLISLSISSMKWMTKSTNLCLYICSVWKLVIKKLISYP